MKGKSLFSTLAVLLIGSMASPALAIDIGGLGKKSGGVDVGQALTAGSDLIGYVTVATDLGNQAADLLVGMYPPEKVKDVAKLSQQIAELKGKAKDGNVDAEQLKLSEDRSAALEKMKKEGQLKDFNKEKTGNVSKAYGKLGLMVLADGVAATKVKPTVDGLQAALNQVTKDPTQAGKLETIKYQIATLTAVGAALPKQISSANSVRSICSEIAAAEKMKLPTEFSPDSAKDSSSIKAASKSID